MAKRAKGQRVKKLAKDMDRVAKAGRASIRREIAKLLSKHPYNIDEDGVTQSLLGSFLNCPERCHLHLAGYRPLQTKESLMFGSLMHWLMELLAKDIRAGKILPEDGTAFFEKHIKTWVKKTIASGSMDAQTVEFLAAQAAAVFPGYCMYWAKDDFVPDSWLEVEGVFDTVWRGTRLRGRRDGIRLAHGKRRDIYRLFETKNKKQIPTRLDDALLIDFQNQFYLTALNNELERYGIGCPVREVLYNIIRRPNQTLSKKGESLQAYTARVREDVAERPDHYYKRFKLSYTKDDLARFADDLERKIILFRKWLRGVPLFDKNETQCMGQYVCEFLSACVSGEMHEYRHDGKLFEELYD